MNLLDLFRRPKSPVQDSEIQGRPGILEQLISNLFGSKTWNFENPNPQPTPTPTPTPEPNKLEYRNPLVEQWAGNIRAGKYSQRNQNPLKIDELISGLDIASKEYDVPKDLLTDIAGLETMLGFYDRPINQYPGQYDDESNARGPFQFLEGTAIREGLEPNERYSATESARATARKLNKGQLGEWDISDKAGAGGGRLTDWYSKEELDPYSFASRIRRAMLKDL